MLTGEIQFHHSATLSTPFKTLVVGAHSDKYEITYFACRKISQWSWITFFDLNLSENQASLYDLVPVRRCRVFYKSYLRDLMKTQVQNRLSWRGQTWRLERPWVKLERQFFYNLDCPFWDVNYHLTGPLTLGQIPSHPFGCLDTIYPNMRVQIRKQYAITAINISQLGAIIFWQKFCSHVKKCNIRK